MKTKRNILLVSLICATLVVSCSASEGGNAKPQPTATRKAPTTGSNSNSGTGSGTGSNSQSATTKKDSTDANDSMRLPDRPGIPPSDIFDQFVFTGQGGPKCPAVAKFDDHILLDCFKANQKVRILLYKSGTPMVPSDFYAEFHRQVDADGNLTLAIENGSGTSFNFVVLDEKTNKELFPNAFNCPDINWSRLEENSTARVTFTDGTPLRLRKMPSTVAGNIIDEFDEGTQLKIKSGPICSQDYLWWEVNVNGEVGWMAEGDGRVRFLEPAP